MIDHMVAEHMIPVGHGLKIWGNDTAAQAAVSVVLWALCFRKPPFFLTENYRLTYYSFVDLLESQVEAALTWRICYI
jgi:hypothetical protein